MTSYIDANTFGNINVYVDRNGDIIIRIIEARLYEYVVDR